MRTTADPERMAESPRAHKVDSPEANIGPRLVEGTARNGPPELDHRCVTSTGGVPLSQAHLTDHLRLAVLLQGAALLAHLEHGGWYLPTGWEEARVDEEGRLRVGRIKQGRPNTWSQVELRRLLALLFRTQVGISGRGAARRTARRLLNRWRDLLLPVSADRAVEEILDTAPFLWQTGLADLRRCLVAEHTEGGARHLWIAGRADARRRILAHGADLRDIEDILVSQEAQNLWDGYRNGDDPQELLAAGQRRRAVAAWRRHPPKGAREALLLARCLYDLGLYSQSLEALKRRSGFEARLLRARCQVALHQLGAAHMTVRKLAAGELSAKETIRLAEVAIRILGARGQTGEITSWVERCWAAAEDSLRLQTTLLAAGAAWDLNELDTMAQHLDDARKILDETPDHSLDLTERWHRLRGLLANAVGDGLRAGEHLGTALALHRRQLTPATAGRLWSGLASARVYADDLAGAERACRHAVRLLSRCEGPIPVTLPLHNLAEVRLRRGRLEGVEGILERSTAYNRHADNRRALMYDLELWVRLELVLGRPATALARVHEALDQLDDDLEARRSVFDLFAARALGWQGRNTQATRRLREIPPDSSALRELEPEERPAVFALAGLNEEARTVAAETPWATLWSALLADREPPLQVWQELELLDPYRAARLIFDCEMLRAGTSPPRRIRQASHTLRQVGADSMAEWLENRSLSPWRSALRYLEESEQKENLLLASQQDRFQSLLTGAGYSEARLLFRRRGRDQILVDGQGGKETLSATCLDGELILEAHLVDDALRTLFALLRRDLKIEPGPPMGSRSSRTLEKDGIVGTSKPLQRAIERLDRLARGKLPILILGESGTGKELAAQRVHRASQRKASLLPVNCAALSENLIQSELFGHVRGAFTGAERDRVGVFEAAAGGTVFLDEIGDLPLDAQGKLLRVLQESEVRRVGESFTRKVDVRVVAATHRNLEEMVETGTFRQDLYFRLKVATISLPPLKERGEDILKLAAHFLCRASAQPLILSPKARNLLLAYPWPGNIRELQNTLEVAAALTEGDTIYPEHLDLRQPVEKNTKGIYHQQVDSYRRSLVEQAMLAVNGHQAEAARRLGISAQSLSYLVRKFKIS